MKSKKENKNWRKNLKGDKKRKKRLSNKKKDLNFLLTKVIFILKLWEIGWE